MPLTVNQCKASEMATLTNTLELFDTFKPQEEEKDSDEESFHLPLVECEEDGENTKSDVDCKKNNVNGITGEENEDDILNKFDVVTASTPDIIDANLEETLLDDKDDDKERAPTPEEKPSEDQPKDCDAVTSEVSDENTKGECGEMDVDKVVSKVDMDKSDAVAVEKEEDPMDVDTDTDCDLPNGFIEVDSCGNDGNQSLEEAEDQVLENSLADSDVVMADEKKQIATDGALEQDNAKMEDTASTETNTEPNQTEEDIATKQNPDVAVRFEEENLTAATAEKPQSPLKDDDEQMTELSPAVEQKDEAVEKTDLKMTDVPVELTSAATEINSAQANSTFSSSEIVENNVQGKELAKDSDKVDSTKEEKDAILSEEKGASVDEVNVNARCQIATASSKVDQPISENLEDKSEKDGGSILCQAEAEDSDALEAALLGKDDTSVGCNGESEVLNTENEDAMLGDAEDEDMGANNEDTSPLEETGNEPSELESPVKSASDESAPCQTPSEGESNLDEGTKEAVAQSEDTAKTKCAMDESESPKRQDGDQQPVKESGGGGDTVAFPEPSKSPDLDSEDLLDVSMIRDQAEDDADLAAASVTAAGDVEGDEEKTDKEEREGSGDKAASDAAEDDDTGGDGDSFVDDVDKDHDEDVEVHLDDRRPSVDTDVEAADVEKPTTATSSEVAGPHQENAEVGMDVDGELQDKDETAINLNQAETPITEQAKEAEKPSSGKRPASEVEDDVLSTSKRAKLATTYGEEEPRQQQAVTKPQEQQQLQLQQPLQEQEKSQLKSLLSLSEFMRERHLSGLTRAALEEFCVQKICEVIVHRSELGDTNQQLRVQEQMVEQLRRDQQQLNKQVRDLEIVNKKLMQELRMNKKPLIPLRITRSVGLQVRLAGPQDAVKRNRQGGSITSSHASPQVQQQKVLASPNRLQRIVPNSGSPVAGGATPGVVRQVQQSPQKVLTTTPILTSVLQQAQQPNRRPPPLAVATPGAATPAKGAAGTAVTPPARRSGGSGVIDLTDEDDRRNEGRRSVGAAPGSADKKQVVVGGAAAAAGGAGKQQLAVLGPGVRLATTPTQVKGVVASSAGQLMYVLPSGVITTTAGGAQKAVLLNVQSNGFLTSSPLLNGSAVSVIPKASAAVTQKAANVKTVVRGGPGKHPAPLPVPPPVRHSSGGLKPVPPKPHLSIRKTDTGIILQWRMPYDLDAYEPIASYQLYAYQETSQPPSTDMWRRVGDVKALALPMACTLTQFADKNKYYFAVRPVDVYKRIGVFSDPEEISL